jgi:hypothetical protein
MNQSQREIMAYHEAGHAVAAIEVGVEIGQEGVSIVPGEGFSGLTHLLLKISSRPDFKPADEDRLGAEKLAIASLAGHAAQRKYRPSSVRSDHGQSDRKNVVDLMSRFAPRDRGRDVYLKWLRIRAEELVANDATWTKIEAVAKALVERDRLSAEEAKEVASGAWVEMRETGTGSGPNSTSAGSAQRETWLVILPILVATSLAVGGVLWHLRQRFGSKHVAGVRDIVRENAAPQALQESEQETDEPAEADHPCEPE